MTYATSTPMNAPRKYNTIKTDAPDYLLAILSPYSTKSNGSCSVWLPSIALPRTSHRREHTRRTDRSLESLPSPHGTDPSSPHHPPPSSRSATRWRWGEKECSSGGVTRRSGPVGRSVSGETHTRKTIHHPSSQATSAFLLAAAGGCRGSAWPAGAACCHGSVAALQERIGHQGAGLQATGLQPPG